MTSPQRLWYWRLGMGTLVPCYIYALFNDLWLLTAVLFGLLLAMTLGRPDA